MDRNARREGSNSERLVWMLCSLGLFSHDQELVILLEGSAVLALVRIMNIGWF